MAGADVLRFVARGGRNGPEASRNPPATLLGWLVCFLAAKFDLTRWWSPASIFPESLGPAGRSTA